MIDYKVHGTTMVLSEMTTAAWKSGRARIADATQREIRRDAQIVANALGQCEIQAHDGKTLDRKERSP